MNSLAKIALIISAAMFTSPVLSQKTVTRIDGGNSEFALTASEISRYEGQALDGSVDAAEKLANFYGMLKLDFNQELYWDQVAAENGSPSAMNNYWVIGRLSENPNVRRRALFWLRKGASLGDPDAQEALRELSDKKQK